ncbi:hypothetical protein HHA04nite_23850 [Halomonas halophila]|uniref:Uncharacterized protein n=2 Tax=Halomonadaceae TaxID=28256 RepID=A0ABQ0U5X3_9GAMM|nr:hypothetical protein HHA04nite_23850 [Halomonas halophila]
MQLICAFKAKPVERYAQLFGGCVLIAFALAMSSLSDEIRFLFTVFGVAGIGFGLLSHFYHPFRVFDEHLESRKTPISPKKTIPYSSIQSVKKKGESKIVVHHDKEGTAKRTTLYTGLLAKDDRDALMEHIGTRANVVIQD